MQQINQSIHKKVKSLIKGEYDLLDAISLYKSTYDIDAKTTIDMDDFSRFNNENGITINKNSFFKACIN